MTNENLWSPAGQPAPRQCVPRGPLQDRLQPRHIPRPPRLAPARPGKSPGWKLQVVYNWFVLAETGLFWLKLVCSGCNWFALAETGLFWPKQDLRQVLLPTTLTRGSVSVVAEYFGMSALVQQLALPETAPRAAVAVTVQGDPSRSCTPTTCTQTFKMFGSRIPIRLHGPWLPPRLHSGLE